MTLIGLQKCLFSIIIIIKISFDIDISTLYRNTSNPEYNLIMFYLAHSIE